MTRIYTSRLALLLSNKGKLHCIAMTTYITLVVGLFVVTKLQAGAVEAAWRMSIIHYYTKYYATDQYRISERCLSSSALLLVANVNILSFVLVLMLLVHVSMFSALCSVYIALS